MRKRTDGKTTYAIARDLNRDAVPTAQGARAAGPSVVFRYRRDETSIETGGGPKALADLRM